MTGREHTLTANLSPEGKTKWEIGKKVTYSVSTNGIAITPVVELRINGQKVAPFSVDGEEIDEESEWKDSLCISGYLPNVDFIAYAKVAQEGKTEDKVALPYVIECSTDNGKTWNSTVSMAHVPMPLLIYGILWQRLSAHPMRMLTNAFPVLCFCPSSRLITKCRKNSSL